MISKDIKNSFLLARKYIEECCITVDQDGQTITGFTECNGKMRVTHWGGTSSALELLKITGYSDTPGIEKKIREAEEWLINDQFEDGSWEAAEMQCSEATAAVIYDLRNLNLLSDEKCIKAFNFIQSCYNNSGYFLSRPSVDEIPHIYTTYLAVRTLSFYNQLSNQQKNTIINRVKNSKSIDGIWGATKECVEGDIAHTVFALLILFYCDVPIEELMKENKESIKWLKKQIKSLSTLGNAFTYEAIEVYSKQFSDQYGYGARILKSFHFNLSLLCDLFIKLKDYGVAYRIIKKMIKLRGVQNGWGISSEGKIFVWATQQAIDCMYEFEQEVFATGSSIRNLLRNIVYKIPYFRIKFCVFLVLIPLLVWLLQDQKKGPDMLLSAIFLIVPWLIKRED